MFSTVLYQRAMTTLEGKKKSRKTTKAGTKNKNREEREKVHFEWEEENRAEAGILRRQLDNHRDSVRVIVELERRKRGLGAGRDEKEIEEETK